LVLPLIVLLMKYVGSRPFRISLKFWNGFGFSKVNQIDLRALIAEGSYESLHYALQFIRTQRTARGWESFDLTYWLATKNCETLIIRLSQEQQQLLVTEAEITLSEFGPEYWKNPNIRSELENQIEHCEDSPHHRRLNRILLLVKQRQTENTAFDYSVQRQTIKQRQAEIAALDYAKQRQTKMNAENLTGLFPSNEPFKKWGYWMFMLIALPIILVNCQVFFYLSSHLFDFMFPLAEPIGIALSDIGFAIQTLEFVIVYLIAVGLGFPVVMKYRRWEASKKVVIPTNE